MWQRAGIIVLTWTLFRWTERGGRGAGNGGGVREGGDVGVKYGSRKLAWRSHSAGVKKSGSTARREKIVYEAFHPANPKRAAEEGGRGGGAGGRRE